MVKNLITFLLFISIMNIVSAQPSPQSGGSNSYSFIDYQKTFPRPSEALGKKEDTLQKQFEAQKLVWPAKYMYIRSFKYDSQLEVWVKNDVKEQLKPTKYVHWQVLWDLNEWKEITRCRKVFITSMNLIRKVIIIYRWVLIIPMHQIKY
jgi:hypothetical protein